MGRKKIKREESTIQLVLVFPVRQQRKKRRPRERRQRDINSNRANIKKPKIEKKRDGVFTQRLKPIEVIRRAG